MVFPLILGTLTDTANIKRSLSCPRLSLVRIIFLISLTFDRGVYASEDSPLSSPENPLFEATDCELKILNSIYSALDNDTKHLLSISTGKIDLLPKKESLSLYGQLIDKKILKDIEYLDLSGCDIKGLPSSIFSHLKSLRILNISGNPSINLKSPTFNRLCHQLVELDASECSIDEDGFSLICNCNKLEKLNISGNASLDLVSRAFERLCLQLVELDLSKCNVDESILSSIFIHLKNLKKLSLSGNPSINLKSDVFAKLCCQLVELSVSQCSIDGDILSPTSLHMKSLKILNLSGNPHINLKSDVFAKLCSQLVELDASGCNIDEDTFSTICDCPKLEKLNISKNPNIKFPNQKIIMLKDTIKDLRIDSCELSVEDMQEIAQFKYLEVLDISNNFLKEYFKTSDFGSLKNTLSELRASNIGLSFESFAKVRECKKLETLDVSHNDLSKDAYAHIFFVAIIRSILGYKDSSENILFGDLANNLRILNISRANLNVYHLKEILNFPAIKTLYCSFNNFIKLDDGFKIGEAKALLSEANFSHCNIASQKFLEEIFDCRSLSKANISNNRFIIECSTLTLGSSVKSLKWLDISKSGIILKPFIEIILGKFEKIEYLDLTANVLQPVESYDPHMKPYDLSKVISVFGMLRTSLKILKMSKCQIQCDFDFLYSITDCVRLEYLDISLNLFGKFPKDFEFGSSRKTLKELHMNSCLLNGEHTLKTITNLGVLNKLYANDNQFSYLSNEFKFGISTDSLKILSITDSSLCDISFFQAIASCKILEVLNLSENDLCSCSADDFENFDFGLSRCSLKAINISSCNLNLEKVLKAITNCSNLCELNLSGNDFGNLSDDFSFGESKDALKILDMHFCSLKGPRILKEITSCGKLEQLDLSFNDFSGEFENFSFGDARLTLKELEMSRCEINDLKLLEAISFCEVLETLSVEKNKFSLVKSKVFRGKFSSSLKNLSVKGLAISKIEDFYCLFDCPKLETLDISHISLQEFEEDLNFERFGSSKSTLKKLYIDACDLKHSSSLKTFTSFPKLEIIDISNNDFGPFSEDFSLGVSKDSLREIMAEYCNFKDAHIIKALTDCKELRSLTLNRNYFLEMDKVAFGVSKDSLKILNLASCSINPIVWINEIAKCNKIQKLNLAHNDLGNVTNQFDCGKLKDTMVYLDISECRIYNLKILSSLTKYCRLRYLKLKSIIGLTSSFDFGNLEYKLDYFYLENSDSDIAEKVRNSFLYLNNIEYYYV